MLALVDLVTDGVASGLQAGGCRCVGVLRNICEILLDSMIWKGQKTRNILLLASLEA